MRNNLTVVTLILLIGIALLMLGLKCPWEKDDDDDDVTIGSSGILPNAPSGLTADAVSSSQIDLSWTDNSNNDDGFKIERKTGAEGTYAQIDIVGPNITSYSNTGLEIATYYYKIYAYNSAGISAYSNTVSGTTTWAISTIGNSGGQGSNYNISIAVDSNDKVHICYLYYPPFNDINYATNVSGSWVFTPLDNVDIEAHPSMTLDKNDKVHISYNDDSVSYKDLYYGTNASESWVHTTIDETGDVGRWNDIAVDTINKVHISYLAGIYLKYATNITGTWVTTTVDNTTEVRNETSIATDGNNKVHISYMDYTNKYLKYATNITGTWVTTTIDNSGTVGGNSSIIVDSNDKVHISYYDYINKDLEYATNASGVWVTTTIDSADEVGGGAIARDLNDKIHISYYDMTNKALKYATNASGSWVITTIDSAGDVGAYSSIAIDSTNKVHIAYQEIIATDGNVKYATNK